MKKGFTSLMLLILLIMAPSISLASEIESPLDSLGLTETLDKLTGVVKPVAVKNESKEAAEGISSMESVSNLVTSASQPANESERKSLLGVELNLPIVGKVNLGLLTSEKGDSNSKQTANSSGLLELEVSDSKVLGDVKVGVLTSETQADKNLSGGLVSIDATSSLVDLHIGIGNSGKVEKTPDEAPADEPVLESDTSQPVDSDLPSEQSSMPAQIENQAEQKDMTESVKPSLSTTENHDDIDPLLDTVNRELPIDLDETFAKADFLEGNDAVESFPSIAQVQYSAEDLEQMEIIIHKLKDIDRQQVSPTGSMNTAGSSSGSAGASNVNSSLGIAAFLGSEYLSEVALCSQVSNRLVELSDQWSKSPPTDPPKVSFFLYA
ncbi:hypothetical protein [Bacillus tuaregi]|uniref:hypothetical protein n=1 Tax=Bacillus tuaregi TaxID=1816695 RepID=UPI0008F9748C|nr:hypothetical protein [Bacillus tuaregi]